MGRLFGTDGARGIANKDLTCELAMNIGRAAAEVFKKHCDHRPTVLIGKDTRISSDMLENALTAGLCSVGVDVIQVGFVPTPAVAFLVKNLKCDAGFMISASHNPCEYNGIKIFNGEGFKLPDSMELEIEEIILDREEQYPVLTGGEVGRIIKSQDAVNKYVEHVRGSVDSLKGLKIALDCANGSSSVTVRDIFEALGAECYIMSAEPDGVNINTECGSTDMRNLIEFVKNNEVDLGLAFDGDADRCLAVDENGELIDGDRLIAVFAKSMKDAGTLKNNTAVITVMTNMGFKVFAKENGINVAETGVGDRYVLECMVENGYGIGGEQSGHIIFRDYATTGDGQLSGLQFASLIKQSGKKASELASCMQVYPQVLLNVRIQSNAKALLEDSEVQKIITETNTVLGDNGRVLVRASGTEPLIRVMLEGKDIDEITLLAEKIADTVKSRAEGK